MIKPLTSLRFFFAFFVFLSHLQGIKSGNPIFNWFVRNIFFEGYIGVSFFFILSGFVISYSNDLKISKNKFHNIRFYKARFFRLYPLYLLTMLICAVSIANISWPTWLINIFAIQSFLPTINSHVINAPSWSISNEFFFYFSFPFIFPFIYKYKITSVLLLISLSIILFSLSLKVPDIYIKFIYYINPFSRLFDFSLGILLYHFFKYINSGNHKRLTTSTWEYLAILLLIVFFLPHNAIPRMYRFSVYYWIPMSAIILIFALEKGRVSKLLQNKILVYLGEISFSFYMIHLFVITKMLPFLDDSNPIVTIFVILLATLFFSILLFEYFEKPVNKFLKRKFLNT